MVTDVTSETVIAAVEGLIVKNKSTTVKIRDFLAKPDVHAKYLWKKRFYSTLTTFISFILTFVLITFNFSSVLIKK